MASVQRTFPAALRGRFVNGVRGTAVLHDGPRAGHDEYVKFQWHSDRAGRLHLVQREFQSWLHTQCRRHGDVREFGNFVHHWGCSLQFSCSEYYYHALAERRLSLSSTIGRFISLPAPSANIPIRIPVNSGC